MTPLCWPDEFASGHHTIDQCHRQLFDHLNRLVDSCEQGEGCRHAVALLRFLQDNLDSQFSAEEDLMRQAQFPDRGLHERHHRDFARTIRHLGAEIDRDKPAENESMTAFNEAVIDWVLQHVCVEDRAFCAFLHEQNR